MRPAAATLALLAAVGGDGSVAAQSLDLAGYYQNVPLWSGGTSLVEGGVSDFNRARLAVAGELGDVSLRVAYEQLLTLRERAGSALAVGAPPGGGEWLGLQWTLSESTHALWRHRFDRLELSWAPGEWFELAAGRQAVSWATTLLLTPADPFTPFDPADPFREFRAGVDAARIRVYPTPLSELDLVVRVTDGPGVDEETTLLGRGLFTWRGFELSAWAGSLYGDVAGAFAAAGAIGGTALRFEGVLREGVSGELVARTTIGFDRRFGASGRDLFVVVEYQRDELAAARAEDYAAVLASPSFARGELQVLGRDELAVRATYQLHPLWSAGALALVNLGDGSALLSPSLAFSASDEMALTAGVFVGVGADTPAPGRPLPSEFGHAGTTLYASFSVFF